MGVGLLLVGMRVLYTLFSIDRDVVLGRVLGVLSALFRSIDSSLFGWPEKVEAEKVALV
jgi:hypothetical protein